MSDAPIWMKLAIGVVSSGSLAAIIQLARDFLRRRAARLYDRGYGDISRIYALLQGLLNQIKANRVVIMVSENGGGIPSPGCQVKSSVRYEVLDRPAKPIQPAWQLVPLDQDYAAIVAQVNSQGRALIDVASLNEGFLTSELLQASQASHCHLFRICATPHALLYLSVQYSSPDSSTSMDVDDHAATRGVLIELRSIFSRHHQLVKREPQQ